MLRQPIVSIMGHVDHGKTTLLDSIRGSAVASKEAGGITQAIGASIIPLETVKKICGDLMGRLNFFLTIPGLLFIDTPGHAAFINLRKRGGNLADLAILVVDINEGFMPQTIESLNILKAYKTPFIIAANKIDLIDGWYSQKKPLLKIVEELSQKSQQFFETKIYELVGKLFDQGFNADRFDRVSDYSKQIAVVPISAKTGDGIPELLMVLIGLAQKFLEKNLNTTDSGAKGTVLEVKEQTGLGKVLDVIIYDGTINVNDQVLVGTTEKPVLTKVKALFQPAPLSEMREQKSKFVNVKSASAATGVRIVAQEIDNVVGGMPLQVVEKNVKEIEAEMLKELGETLLQTEQDGIVIKADNLGSLEALLFLLKEKNIPVRKASIGIISKKDIADAESMLEKNELNAVILCFNVPKTEEHENVKIFHNEVIYRLIEDYQKWVDGKKKNIQLQELEKLTKPCKIEILNGYVFRASNPAVCGVEVVEGTLKSNTPVMKKDGKILTTIKGVQVEQKNVEKLDQGKRGAVSMPNITIGRQLVEGEILYSFITEKEFQVFKEFKDYLTVHEKHVLKEITDIMRKNNPVWGV